MSRHLKQIEEQALALDTEERAQLVDSLLESLLTSTVSIESAWADEIERRVAAIDRGEVSAYPAEDVFADARRLTQ